MRVCFVDEVNHGVGATLQRSRFTGVSLPASAAASTTVSLTRLDPETEAEEKDATKFSAQIPLLSAVCMQLDEASGVEDTALKQRWHLWGGCEGEATCIASALIADQYPSPHTTEGFVFVHASGLPAGGQVALQASLGKVGSRWGTAASLKAVLGSLREGSLAGIDKCTRL